jgi:hypothetical protein
VAPPSAPRNQAAESGLRRIELTLSWQPPSLTSQHWSILSRGKGCQTSADEFCATRLLGCTLGGARRGFKRSWSDDPYHHCHPVHRAEEPLKDRRGRADIYGRNKTSPLHPAISQQGCCP